MIEVPNVYRSINKLFVKKDDLDLYNKLKNINDEKSNEFVYCLSYNSANDKTWKQMKLFKKINFR